MTDFDEDDDLKDKLNGLINDLCLSGLKLLDQDKLKQIKSICKSDEKYVKLSHQMLLTQLNKEHSEIRYAALQIVDCLFQRSAVFRDLIVDEFQAFFDLVLELDPDEELPPPKKAAKELKKLAPKIIKQWHEKFAADYKRLDIGFNYLKNCKKIDFVSYSHQTVAQRNQNQKELERQQIFLNKKYDEYLKEMNDSETDIKNSLEQLERCINILVPKSEELFTNEDFNLSEKVTEKSCIEEANKSIDAEVDNYESDSDDDDDDFVEVRPKKSKEELEEDRYIELRYLGILNDDNKIAEPMSIEQFKSVNLTIDLHLRENHDNKVVIDIMRDMYKELKKSWLSKINNWIKNFTQIKTATNNLKRAIELKNLVQEGLKRFENLNIIDLESIEKEKKRNDANEKIKSLRVNSAQDEDDPDKPGTSKSKETVAELSEKERKKQEMLKIAPVIELSEMEFMAPVVQKIEAPHRFYGGREEGDSLPQGVMESASRLTKTTFIGKYEPVKWSCRAPLKSGKLCPRMDRFKCPLHGKIVARDEKGEIANEQDRIEYEKREKTATKKDVPAWQDRDLIADINAATGLNLQVVGDKKERKGAKRKSGELNSKNENSSRKRLEKRLLHPKNLNKIGSILDSIERRQYYERFHHNFNYALDS